MTNRWTVVLDDDPTGTQGLSEVPVVVHPTEAAFEWALDAGELVYVLTNTRALTPEATRDVVTDAVIKAQSSVRARGGEVRFVSRGDSTLRGHFPLEVQVILEHLDRPARGCLLVPAFPEAGRYTLDGIHVVNDRGTRVPAAETEYARDATFGYSSSRLTDWAAERVPADWRVVDLPSRVFDNGPTAIAAFLRDQDDFTVVCPSIRDHHDLERLAAAQLAVEAEGIHYLVQSGPPYPRRLADHGPAMPARPFITSQRGLIVVGSHTGTTTGQLDALQQAHETVIVELDVPSLLEEPEREVERVARAAALAMKSALVVLQTSRKLVSDTDKARSLTIANIVGTALMDVTRRLLDARPAFVIAKGGITSRDVVAEALGWDAATVIGPLVNSTLPVWESWKPSGTDPVCVIFPGNVGGPDLLARAVTQLEGLEGPLINRKGA